MESPKTCELTINDVDYILEIGKCACVLFRREAEMDHLVISGEDHPTRVFGNPDLVHWLVGYVIRHEDGDLLRPTTFWADEAQNNETFRQRYGWNPLAIERELPDDKDRQRYSTAITQEIEQEWREMG